MTRIDLGSVVTSEETVSADGAVWLITNVDGYDSPTQRGDRMEPSGLPGTRRLGTVHGGRSLEASGAVRAFSSASAWDAYYRCAGALPGIGGVMPFTVFEDVPKSLLVVQDAPPEVGKPYGAGDCWEFEFTLRLLAEYPYKRAITSETVTVGAGATVSHSAAGTFPAEIEVTLTSPGTVDLSIAGLRLRAGSLPAGAVLTSGPGFANPKRTIRSSTGANLFGLIVQPMSWPAMVPGGNSIRQAGTAGLSVRYFPTYA